MRIERVGLHDLAAIGHLTFPAVQKLVRDRFASETIAVAAYSGSDAVGLALGVRGPHAEWELLSVFVMDLLREQGIGGALLRRLEGEFASQGYQTGVHFLTVDPADQRSVRFLMREGWAKPVIVKLICRSTMEQAFKTPWLVRAQMPAHHRVISWSNLAASQRDAIAAGIGNWIPRELDPFDVEADYDDSTSIALVAGEESEGRVAGWVLTHRLDGSTLRWTCSFVDPAIQGSGRILPLWLEVAQRQRELAEMENFVFTVPLTQPRMVRFATRYMRPWLTSLAYSCMTTKRLPSPET
ncbi:GNAT family N-acetyltransferase [Microvirga puerhi]|uniref:GNAT family N-acetyltransferase n=1 Tax=Microvirga puerhi TaxID=2876078 RepID=A0ABS7VH46_9HYPH|nr:GNAT family N-acetyltransferase [Microvirga puerhi]MBZ6074822.1 GNAT family N-acetyltransferase [Microvirga puerhi]